MIHPYHLKIYLILPTLIEMSASFKKNFHSDEAVDLLCGTVAQESGCGYRLRQMGQGPAVSIYQMEPETHEDLWENFLKYRSWMKDDNGDPILIKRYPEDMVGDLRYATIMTRLNYYRVREALPQKRIVTDRMKTMFIDKENKSYIPQLAAYWKKYYNTSHGAGTKLEFIENFHKFQEKL